MAQLKINDSYPLPIREQAQEMLDRMGSKKQVGPESTPYIKHGQMTVYRSGATTFHVRGRCVDFQTGKRSKAFNKKVGNAWGDDYATVLSVAAQLLNKVQAGLNPRHAEQTLDDFHAEVVTLVRQVLDSWPDCKTRYRLHISPIVGRLPLGSIQTCQLQQAVDKVAREGSFPLANRVLAEAQAIFRVAVEQGRIERNPAANLRGYPENPPRQRIASDEEIIALRAASMAETDRYAGLLVRLLIETPLRIGEALAAQWRDYDPTAKTLALRNTKSCRPMFLPLTTGALAVIRELAEVRAGDYLFPNKAGNGPKPRPDSAFRRICKRAGLEDFRFQDLRRSFCSRACRSNVPIELASALLNHSSIAVTARHYRVIGGPELAKAAQMVSDSMAHLMPPVEG